MYMCVGGVPLVYRGGGGAELRA